MSIAQYINIGGDLTAGEIADWLEGETGHRFHINEGTNGETGEHTVTIYDEGRPLTAGENTRLQKFLLVDWQAERDRITDARIIDETERDVLKAKAAAKTLTKEETKTILQRLALQL
jgi:hypothetical protein